MTDTISLSPVRTVDGRNVPAPGAYTIDTAHSSVEFVARHLVVSKVRGGFADYAAEIVVAERPEESTLKVDIQAASITTGDPTRDGHLVSADFLDVENHPAITFVSTSIVPDGDAWNVTGDFTVGGVTKPITLAVEFGGAAVSPWGTTALGFSASGEFDREDFGVTYNQPLAGGGVLVGKKIVIDIQVELNPAGVAA